MSDSTMTIDKWGTKHWRNSVGELHRTDGPAIERDNGGKSWYVKGKLHRINGPAIEYANGCFNVWCVDGKFLGQDGEGFWALWERLSPEEKRNSTLLSYLPEKF